jgi:hypothetical protein
VAGRFNPKGIVSLSPALARFREGLRWVAKRNVATLKGLRINDLGKNRISRIPVRGGIFVERGPSAIQRPRQKICLNVRTWLVNREIQRRCQRAVQRMCGWELGSWRLAAGPLH